MPPLSFESPFLIRISRVCAFLPDITQQIHSLRASGVTSSHTARAFGVAMMAFCQSVGIVCTVPPASLFLVTWLFYQIVYGIFRLFGGSSNGRTAAFGAVNLGSIPSPPAKLSAANFAGAWSGRGSGNGSSPWRKDWENRGFPRVPCPPAKKSVLLRFEHQEKRELFARAVFCLRARTLLAHAMRYPFFEARKR